MNLNELQAFLEDASWDEEPEPAHPSDLPVAKVKNSEGPNTEMPNSQVPATKASTVEAPSEEVTVREGSIPTLIVEPDLQNTVFTAPVKLVPRPKQDPSHPEPELRATDSVRERLKEIVMAQKMGYLLCKCTWPPQIMVLTGTDHVYRCRRCSRVREM